MKKIYLIGILVTFFICCMSKNAVNSKSHEANRKTFEQDAITKLLPPVPPSFSHADSVRLIHNWTIGIRMYKTNCSRCHGIFGNAKDSATNFSKQQFDDYKSSYLAGDSTNHAVMSKMTQEELNNVFLFLIDLKRD